MNDKNKTILVFGATGVQGGAVLRKLREEGAAVRVVVRDPMKAEAFRKQGIEAVTGQLNDAESMARAMRGVNKVFFHLPLEYDPEKTFLYGKHVVDAAAAEGVERIVFNAGSILPDADVQGYSVKRVVRDYLRSSPVPSIVLKPTLYMENIEGPWTLPMIRAQGVFAYPVRADLPVAWVSVRDAAAYAVEALRQEELAGSEFTMYGPELLTGEQIAERLSTGLGREVRYRRIPEDEFEAALRPAVGEAAARDIADVYRWGNDQAVSPFAVDSSQDASRAVPIPRTTFLEYIRSLQPAH